MTGHSRTLGWRALLGAAALIAAILATSLGGAAHAQSQSPAPEASDPLSILKSLTANVAGAGDEEFLNPEEAFKLITEVDGDAITAQWQIAEGYYLYRKRMQFNLAEESEPERFTPRV